MSVCKAIFLAILGLLPSRHAHAWELLSKSRNLTIEAQSRNNKFALHGEATLAKNEDLRVGESIQDKRMRERFSNPENGDQSWYPSGHQEKKGLYLSPILSFFLPGFDQWAEGQYDAAVVYTGGKIIARGLGNSARQAFLNSGPASQINREINRGIDSQSSGLRNVYLFSQYEMMAGGLSTYHSFRTIVESRPEDFAFMSNKDSFGELMTAPFDLSFFKKPTTYVPLAGLMALIARERILEGKGTSSGLSKKNLGADDLVYSGLFSYNAGTYEEMIFRGWLQPVVYYETKSPLVANLANSFAFGLAHANTIDIPVIQTMLGYYLGWLTMENGWSLKESIFVHSWWDLIAFLDSYRYEKNGTSSSIYWLPSLTWAW